MKGKKFQLFAYFLCMMLAAGILFFLAAGLAEPFKKIMLVMNDRSVTKTTKDWALFVALSLPVGAMWASAWLWFKGSEKRFLEVWFSKASQPSAQADAPASGGPAA